MAAIVMQEPGKAKVDGVPPGMEYLTMVDQLQIIQQVEAIEVFTSFETANSYAIKNANGQGVYTAVEEANCVIRNCCGDSRPFTMHINNLNGQEIIKVHRPMRCTTCWCFCCLQKMEVKDASGATLGYVRQICSVVYPKFDIEDAKGYTQLRVDGPLINCSFIGDVEYKIRSKNRKHKIGQILKHFSGLTKELLTDADNYEIKFPLDLDVKMKACLLAALFLIDYMFYERSQNKQTFKICLCC